MRRGLVVLFFILFIGMFCRPSVDVGAKSLDAKTSVKKTGWIIKSRYYKYKKKGKYVKNKIIKIKGKYYYFNKRGVCKTGWIKYKGNKYFFDRDKRYARTGKSMVGSVYYIFDSNGTLEDEIGLYQYKSMWYYIGKKGILKTGWILVDDKYLYFSPATCRMVHGKKKIDGIIHYFDENGVPYNGIYENGKYKFFCNNQGMVLKSTFIDWDSKKYWADEDGHLVSGMQVISSNKYFFNDNCEMMTGFVRLGQNILYFDKETGILLTDRQLIVDNSIYYTDSNGYILRNCWYKGVFLRYDGKQLDNSVSFDNQQSYGFLSDEVLDSLNLDKCTKLMIVAHPDDETLWGGAHLSEGGYFVLCLTNAGNKIRRDEFYKAIEQSGNIGLMLSYPDMINGVRSDWSKEQNAIAKDIDFLMHYKKWGLVVTHNPDGEYGHIQHRACSRIVMQAYYKNYWEENFYYFGIHYSKNNLESCACQLKCVPDKALENKKKLFAIYVSQKKCITDHEYLAAYENWIGGMEWE